MIWKRILSLTLVLGAGLPLCAQGASPVNDSGATAWMLTSTTLVLL